LRSAVSSTFACVEARGRCGLRPGARWGAVVASHTISIS